MDIVFAVVALALWGVAALLARGFESLEKPSGGRP